MFDQSDPEWVWVVDWGEPIDKIEIRLSDDTYQTIRKAEGFYDLISTPEWGYILENNSAIIYGFDLFETTASNKVDTWLFQDGQNPSTETKTTFFLHPKTQQWLPLHPATLRSDGFLGFNYEGQTKVRVRAPESTNYLTNLSIRINDVEATAYRANVWNSVDDHALTKGFYRLDGELNSVAANAIIRSETYAGNNTDGLRSGLSALLRQGQVTTATRTNSSFSIATSGTGLSARSGRSSIYALEVLSYDVDVASGFRTRFSSPTYGQIYVDGSPVLYTMNSSGQISINSLVDARSSVAVAKWVINLWNISGSTITFTDNFNTEGNDLDFYVPGNVDVVLPSNSVLRQSFKKTSPVLRWQSRKLEEDFISGLANFV